MKYQLESTKVSIVSLSRRAGPPHLGQAHLRNGSYFASGLPLPSDTRCSGSTTGRSFSGTGTVPQASQWMIGIGVPQ